MKSSPENQHLTGYVAGLPQISEETAILYSISLVGRRNNSANIWSLATLGIAWLVAVSELEQSQLAMGQIRANLRIKLKRQTADLTAA